jgi:UDP-N-acetylglucosamine acyltransferase
MIHATAVIHPKAQLHPTVRVGPYAVIDGEVVIGAECEIGPHVYVTGMTEIGARNRFYAGGVIGEAAQDLKYKGEPTRLRIGSDNIFREYVTVHRSAHPGGATAIGDGNLLMAHCHVAHDTVIGSKVIITNGALLGGHAVVQDGVVISGNCLVHQFARVGTLAMMQGGSGISKDLPPFTIARGDNGMCGLNIVGLRRAGMSGDERLELKRLYHHLFRSGKKLRAALDEARGLFGSEPCRVVIEFVAASKRGICRDTSREEEISEAAIDGEG